MDANSVPLQVYRKLTASVDYDAFCDDFNASCMAYTLNTEEGLIQASFDTVCATTSACAGAMVGAWWQCCADLLCQTE